MNGPVVPQFDEETYLLWESRQHDRFELHHGFVVAFAGGTLDHDRIAFNLRTELDRLYAEPWRTIGSHVKVRIDAQRYFYPDVAVIRGDFSGSETTTASPHIVVEVLSPSTRGHDLIEKRAAYRSIESLEAYLIVHSDLRRIELDTRRPDGTWQTAYLDNEPFPLGGGVLAPDAIYARTSLA